MIFDAKILTIFIFVILSFAAIFYVENRTSTIITLITTHLTLILFFSLTITNYNFFKEIVLTSIFYLMVVLFLITTYDNIKPNNADILQIKDKSHKKIFAGFVVFIFFSASFYLVNNAFYRMKNIRNSQESNIQLELKPILFEVSELKKNRLKKKLSDNFLLKRSSDIILLIASVASISLLLQRKKSI